MNGLRCYLELTENGRPLDDRPAPPDVQAPLVKLLAHAHRREGVAVQGAWRLDSRVSRQLERRHRMSPAGGWEGLAGLACGCGVLEARREAFGPAATVEEVAGWSAEQTRRRLVESFTRRLAPPAIAAGLFILMRLHPAWGLRIAHDTHTGSRPDSSDPSGPLALPHSPPGWRDETLFPTVVAERVKQATFGGIAAVMAVIRKLSPDQRYPIDALAGVVQQACVFARSTAAQGGGVQPESIGASPDGLAPFVGTADDMSPASAYRTLDFVTADLIDSFLLPAGVVHRFDDGTFCVFEGAVGDSRVGAMDVDAQEVKLTWMLAGKVDGMVA